MSEMVTTYKMFSPTARFAERLESGLTRNRWQKSRKAEVDAKARILDAGEASQDRKGLDQPSDLKRKR
jgi:hypothetical protein